jgi:predicted metal-dependent hydrolase
VVSRHDGRDSKVQCTGVKQDSLQLSDQVIGYVVIRRPRVTRRIHLEIDSNGGLLVVAPGRMSRRAVNRALRLKAGHVARFLRDARSRQQDLPDYFYRSGEEHLFLGERWSLVVDRQSSKRGKVCGSGGVLHVRLHEPTPGRVKTLLSRWYRQQAEQLFTRRLAHYSCLAPWTQGQLPPMRLRRMKRTWGSCSSSGVITLNPHLVKAPADCIDYVVAHEICHLREHNHGKAFYALQDQLYPEWRQAKTLLKEQGHLYLHS